MSHGVAMTPGTDPNAVRAVGLPCALTPNRYSDVRHAAVRAAATNVRPSPVATPVSAVAGNGSLIVAPRAPVLALITTMDGCVAQFSATRKAGVPPPAPATGPPATRAAYHVRPEHRYRHRHRGDGGGRRDRDQQPAPGRAAPALASPAQFTGMQAADPGGQHRLRPDRLGGGAVGIAQPVLYRVHGSSFSVRASAARARAAVDDTVPRLTPSAAAISSSGRSR